MKAGLCALSAFAIALHPTAATGEAPVRVEAATTRAIAEQVRATGTVTSPRTAVLSTAVAGLVADVVVDEGHTVATGDTLVSLDAELAELALDAARVEAQRQETALADAKRRLEEAERIGPDRGIARTLIASLRTEVSGEEAALAASRIAIHEREAIVERHRLKAPFDGVISERLTELGEWVNPGDGLLELVATENLRFDFRMPQDFFGAIQLEAPVDVSVDALPGRQLSGRVGAIVPVKDPSARTFLVRVLADDGTAVVARAVSPGMSAAAVFTLGTDRTGITVSRDALLRYPDGRTTVWVVESGDGDPVVREQVVRTGLEFDGFVEIREGLAAGNRVVVRGNEALQVGQTVHILDGGP